MYNSENLPLSFKKVWKKTLEKSPYSIFAIIITVYFYFSFVKLSTDQSQTTFLTNSTWGVIVFSLLSLIGTFIYQYLYFKSYSYSFEEAGAEITKGVIARSSGNIQYDRLQNIYIDQDVLDRMYGLYDVHYETAGENSGFYSHIDGLEKENADKLVSFLLEKSNTTHPPTQSFNTNIHKENITQSLNNEQISSDTYKLSPSVVWVKTLFNFLICFGVILFILLRLGTEVFSLSDFTNMTLIISITMIWLLIVFIVSYFFAHIWYKNFYFNFTQDRGEIHTKVIAQSISYLYYNRIQNINIKQGILDRLFGLYKISIETAGEKSGKSLVLYGYKQPDAQNIKTFLLNKVNQSKAHL